MRIREFDGSGGRIEHYPRPNFSVVIISRRAEKSVKEFFVCVLVRSSLFVKFSFPAVGREQGYSSSLVPFGDSISRIRELENFLLRAM